MNFLAFNWNYLGLSRCFEDYYYSMTRWKDTTRICHVIVDVEKRSEGRVVKVFEFLMIRHEMKSLTWHFLLF